MLLASYTPTQDLSSAHYQEDTNYFLPLDHYHHDSLSFPSQIPPPRSQDQLMSLQSQNYHNPAIRVQKSSPFSAADQNTQQMLVQHQFPANSWGSSDNLLSPSSIAHNRLSHQRHSAEGHHKRASSASSVASAGPPSPQDTTTVYPHIAGSDTSHFSPSGFDSLDFFATTRGTQMQKSLPTPVHTPIQSNFNTDYQTFSSPHDVQAPPVMRRLLQNRELNHDDDGSYNFSGPQSVSSASHHDSPSTPQTASYDGDFGDAAKSLQNPGFNSQISTIPHGIVTANFDELYNNQLQNVAPQQQQQMIARAGGLSPFRTSLANRFQAAQLDHVASRASSPAHSIQREKSPFRQGYSEQTPQLQSIGNQRFAPPQMTPTQYQQNMNAAAMMAQQRPQQQQPEQPKTVSPKDVELDYRDEDQPSLFPSSQQSQYSLPRQESSLSTTSNFGQPGQYYATVPTNNHQPQQYQFLGQQQRQQGAMRSNPEQSLPDFPARLTSMETTVSSESGQESQTPVQAPKPNPIARPRDTSADVGAYPCTFHGCNQRFGSAVRLQKHRRDFHRQASPNPPSVTTVVSPHSAMNQNHVASAATIASRNAQSGPHRCERINPTTGKPCHSVFSRPYDLTRHEDTIHTGRKQKVRCHLCTEEKTFSRNDALTRHMRVVHPEVDWPGKTRRKGRD